jgi:hypothetical protein
MTWRSISKKLSEKYTLMLVSKGPWGIRFQYALKCSEDSHERFCITAKTADEAVKQGKSLLKHWEKLR